MNELPSNADAMYRKWLKMALRCGGKGPKKYLMLEEHVKGRWRGIREVLSELGYASEVDRIDAEVVKELADRIPKTPFNHMLNRVRRAGTPGGMFSQR